MYRPQFQHFRLAATLAALLAGFGALAAGGTPAVSFNPSSLNFLVAGVGASGSSASDPMLVNSSSAPAVITAITLGGANAGEFRVSGSAVAPCAVGSTIPRSGSAGNFCGLHFTLDPTSVGSKLATATVTFSDGSSAAITVGGEGLVPAPVADVQLVANAGDVALGSTGAGFPLAFVANRGAQGLTINSVAISGPNAADFALSPIVGRGAAPSCTVASVLNWTPAPAINCGIGIAFRPSALGARTATITLATNDPARPLVSLPLAGNGVVAPPPPPPAPVLSTVYVTDLWWNPSEPAWSLNIVHHKVLVVGGAGSDAVVATWNTFNASTAPTWFTLSAGSWTSGLSYSGVLRQSTGSFYANPYLPGQAGDSVVGSASLSFTDANNGTLSYTVGGVTSSRAIVRKAF